MVVKAKEFLSANRPLAVTRPDPKTIIKMMFKPFRELMLRRYSEQALAETYVNPFSSQKISGATFRRQFFAVAKSQDKNFSARSFLKAAAGLPPLAENDPMMVELDNICLELSAMAAGTPVGNRAFPSAETMAKPQSHEKKKASSEPVAEDSNRTAQTGAQKPDDEWNALG